MLNIQALEGVFLNALFRWTYSFSLSVAPWPLHEVWLSWLTTYILRNTVSVGFEGLLTPASESRCVAMLHVVYQSTLRQEFFQKINV